MEQTDFRTNKQKTLLAKILTIRISYWMGLFAVLFLIGGLLLGKQLQKLRQKQKVMYRSVKQMQYFSTPATSYLGNAPAPIRLSNLLLGEDLGIVVGVKQINIRNVTPYNPSLIQLKSGYDLFFRYDVLSSKARIAPFFPGQFEQTTQEFKRIDLKTDYAEDPRIVEVGDELYLFYNDLDQQSLQGRFMSVANLNRDTYAVNYTTALDMNLQLVEKNWSPFEYIDEQQKARFFIEYRIHPRKLLELPNPQVNDLQNITLPREDSFISLLWPTKWGEIRGGTPAKKIGDEYLAFFHSCFKEDSGLVWFNMGAYTFEAKPPFRLTGISSHPILFKGIYDTPLTHTAPFEKRVIYPGGFVIEKQGERELVHVACGENDCAVKIVTMDLKKLKENLIRLEN
jgi:predicted GH43/DUF377 family glycosyl hydrolase